MEKDHFISRIEEQLQKMSEAQKDAWILTKAKLLPEPEQQDFMLSLNGEKMIGYMPAEFEIQQFCEKVRKGDICVEYETHYCEFDSDGRYKDDWEVHHNDPSHAFSFLNRTFCGCHDLIRLGEYDSAGRILDQVCGLGFQVVEAEDSEDFYDDSPFTIADAAKEQLLVMDTREIGYDWILALLLGEKDLESTGFARKLAGILKLELCKKIQMSDFSKVVPEKLLDVMEEALTEEIRKIRQDLEKIKDRRKYWREVYMLEKNMARDQHLVLDIRKKCRKQINKAGKPQLMPVLKDSWRQVCELCSILAYEQSADSQMETDEVWNICEALIRRGRFAEEDWKIRENILREMVSRNFYERYGCSEILRKLAGKLCVTDSEMLVYADILYESGYYERQAAYLFRQYGRRDRYVRYLETHLDRSSREYLELIQCYCEDGNEAGARNIAEQGLNQCRDDLTDLFIFLLKDAKKYGDETRYRKFYTSAKRRKKVDLIRVKEAHLQAFI